MKWIFVLMLAGCHSAVGVGQDWDTSADTDAAYGDADTKTENQEPELIYHCVPFNTLSFRAYDNGDVAAWAFPRSFEMWRVNVGFNIEKIDCLPSVIDDGLITVYGGGGEVVLHYASGEIM